MKPKFTPEQQGEMDAHRELEMILKSLLADESRMAPLPEEMSDIPEEVSDIENVVEDVTDPDNIASEIQDELDAEGIDADVEVVEPEEMLDDEDEDYDLEKIRKLLRL